MAESLYAFSILRRLSKFPAKPYFSASRQTKPTAPIVRQLQADAQDGKISEMIGKRSQNISGKTTVEVKSTSQVLKTPYAQGGVQHSQSTGEVNRDEIPISVQSYVENYFEQVRKQAPPKKQLREKD